MTGADKADRLLYNTCNLLVEMYTERKVLEVSDPIGQDCEAKLAEIEAFPFQKWKPCRGSLMAMCFASKKHIETLEVYDKEYVIRLTRKYWKTHEGRRNWFWWRMGKGEDEDLNDFVQSSPAASAYRKYKKSQLEWRERVNHLHQELFNCEQYIFVQDKFTCDYASSVLGELFEMMTTVRDDFWKWNELLRVHLESVNWDPPRDPFNSLDIEVQMLALEKSLRSRDDRVCSREE